MSTIIGRQIETFHDSVMAAHHEAMKVAEVVTAMTLAKTYVDVIADGIDAMRADGTTLAADVRPEVQAYINRMLVVMPRVSRWARDRAADGHPVDGGAAEEFEEAISRLREALAWVNDPTPWASVRLPEVDPCRPGENSDQPPQSWFDEDVSRLAGPT